MSAGYAFRVTGRLTHSLLEALEPLAASTARTETVMVGTVADRAALHGYIARIEALELELVELQRLPRRSAVGSGAGCCSECGQDVVTGRPDTRA